MKYKIYAYIHLVTLVFYLIRPVLPYIEYAVNKDYIAKHLCVNRSVPHSCCQGKCYLEKQLKKSNDNNNDPKENNTNKKFQNEDVKEFLSPHVSFPKVFETSITYLINPETTFTTRSVSAIFVPPKLKFIF
ncbi:MAG TPA: hypothetical protein VGK38_02435 [Prolixibacteraceae bacterium]|jgi:hypothetical protein